MYSNKTIAKIRQAILDVIIDWLKHSQYTTLQPVHFLRIPTQSLIFNAIKIKA